MRPALRSSAFCILSALLLTGSLVGCGRADGAISGPPEERLGLLTTLPIYWNETASIDEMLAPPGEMPWPRRVLEQDYTILPLDRLDGPDGLESVDTVLLAQPRALSAAENVALDDWVRGGGTAVLVADPLLTGHSRFHIGDRRRPQDVVLVSPILGRWGLELQFREDQADGERAITHSGRTIPVNQAGHLRLREGFPRSEESCALEAAGLIARCRIGEGRALVMADAAFLDTHDGHEQGEAAMEAERQDLLRWLLSTVRSGTARESAETALGTDGDGAGSRPKFAVAGWSTRSEVYR